MMVHEILGANGDQHDADVSQRRQDSVELRLVDDRPLRTVVPAARPIA
jgi:hypothetical protein